jgi:SAM-dependent methyltransferase
MPAQIDYERVRQYFNSAGQGAPSAASYMAHDQDLPLAAVNYRFQAELQTIDDWLDLVPPGSSVLDIGCGAGAWTALFGDRYARVVGIERSASMVEAAKLRTAAMSHVEILECDVRVGLPESHFEFAFLGGLCMYLNDDDVVALLERIKERVQPDGLLLLRESTVPGQRRMASGEYQAVYRTVADYRALFELAGIRRVEVRRNLGYTSMEIAVELVELRRRWLGFLPSNSPLLSALTWWPLRVVAPLSFQLLPRVLERFSIPWPGLQNHFFKLQF